ncbi:hypothetical protein AXE80_06010 [Wenyingzhuangia fucanilytica]|uniref:PL28 ulvan lyase domain-containing protein n=1 Tax=Wenyingzhuangia fucanilytica TaxID=1790137 RepID=A0A1B1Y502_9FLAO|nr:hypothetical protein [Wenyingzhuangia fucanilytica]ANW95861.1 hypothetical protein AXE80_06010 [Wenyingzhuangia fucanilytica]
MKNKLSKLIILPLGLIASCSSENEITFGEKETSGSNSTYSTNTLNKVTNNSKCFDQFKNTDREYEYTAGFDVNKNVNKIIDDRTCFADYSQTTFNNRTYGVYKIAAGTNHIDDLQPRIERTTPSINSNDIGDGSYVRFTGYVTIKRAGHLSDSYDRDDIRDKSGTYIAQAKGKHSGGGGSADPAICLIVAKPIFSGSTQVSYDIYREEITERGGSGVTGRQLVYLTNIPANTRKFFKIENGFTGSGTSRRHYVNVRIGATDYNWDVPSPERALQAKIRFGAYRCHGGEAEILWDGVNKVVKKVPTS